MKLLPDFWGEGEGQTPKRCIAKISTGRFVTCHIQLFNDRLWTPLNGWYIPVSRITLITNLGTGYRRRQGNPFFFFFFVQCEALGLFFCFICLSRSLLHARLVWFWPIACVCWHVPLIFCVFFCPVRSPSSTTDRCQLLTFCIKVKNWWIDVISCYRRGRREERNQTLVVCVPGAHSPPPQHIGLLIVQCCCSF